MGEVDPGRDERRAGRHGQAEVAQEDEELQDETRRQMRLRSREAERGRTESASPPPAESPEMMMCSGRTGSCATLPSRGGSIRKR